MSNLISNNGHSSELNGIDHHEDLKRAASLMENIMPDASRQLSVITNIIIVIFGWLSASLEPFIRYDFGERYLGWIRLYFAYGIMAGFTFISFFSRSQLFIWFFGAFIVLSLYHRLRIFLRNRKGIRWHSMSAGKSYLAFIGNNWLLYRFIEPFLFLAIGGFLWWRIDTTTGAWIILASVGLLVKNQMIYYQMRGRMLDRMDAEIEREFIEPSMQGAKIDQTAGFVMVEVPKAGRGAFKKEEATKTPAIPSRFQDTLKEEMKE